MAHPHPKMDISDLEEVALSGSESDTSYDMADDESPETALENKEIGPKPASEAHENDATNNDKREGKATKSGPQNSNHYVSHPSHIHRAKIGESDSKEEEEMKEEEFYDMYSDQRLGRLRLSFKQEGQAVLNLLNDLVGLEQSGWKDTCLALQVHTRKIALMFGDDIPKLEKDLQTALDEMAGAHKENIKILAEITKFKVELKQETQARKHDKLLYMTIVSEERTQKGEEKSARQKAEELQLQASTKASKFEAKYRKEVNQKNEWAQRCTELEEEFKVKLSDEAASHDAKLEEKELKIRQFAKRATKFEEDYFKEMHKKNLLLQEHHKLQEFKSEQMVESRQLKACIKNQELQLQQAAEKASTSEEALSKETHQKNALVQQCNELGESNSKLVAEAARYKTLLQENEQQLENDELHRSQLQAAQAEHQGKLEREILEHKQSAFAFSATKRAEKRENEKLIAENKFQNNTRLHLIEELETTKAKLAEATMELKATASKHDFAVEQLKWVTIGKFDAIAALEAEKDANEEAIYKTMDLEAEIAQLMDKLQQIEMRDETVVAGERRVLEKLREELMASKKQVESIEASVKSQAALNAQKVDLIETQYTQLAKLRDQLDKMGLASDRQAESSSVIHLSELVQEIGSRISSLEAQFNVTTEAHNELVDDRKALSTLVVSLEKGIAAEKQNSETVRDTARTLFQKIYNMPELRSIGELLSKTSDLGYFERNAIKVEALEDILMMVTSFRRKVLDIKTQYQGVLGPFAPSNDSGSRQAAAVENAAQELLNMKSELTSTSAALQTLTQTNLRLSASHAAEYKRLGDTNIQLVASHAAALKELTERRTQITEFEALQSTLQLNEGRAIAQMNKLRTESQCLKDLHDQDLEIIKHLEADLHKSRQLQQLEAEAEQDSSQADLHESQQL